MPKQRNHDRVDFKAKVALAARKGPHPVNEMAAHCGVHRHPVGQWKKQALEALPNACSTRRVREAQAEEALKAQLYQQIGQLKVAWDGLEKKVGLSA
jgi:hypothetical protein